MSEVEPWPGWREEGGGLVTAWGWGGVDWVGLGSGMRRVRWVRRSTKEENFVAGELDSAKDNPNPRAGQYVLCSQPTNKSRRPREDNPTLVRRMVLHKVLTGLESSLVLER